MSEEQKYQWIDDLAKFGDDDWMGVPFPGEEFYLLVDKKFELY